MIQGNITEEAWAEAQRWGQFTGTPDDDLAAALIHRALHAVHQIQVQPMASWMRKTRTAETDGIAVTVLNGRNWWELDDRLRAVRGARPMTGPTARAWYSMPYTHLDTIRTLFADAPDRVRICRLDGVRT